MLKKIIKIFSFLLVLLGVYLGTLYAIQDELIFYPERTYTSPSKLKMSSFVENKIKAKDGTEIMTWYAKGDETKPALISFHGNSGQIAKFAKGLEPLIKEGYTILAMEYRGFANTKGKITQEKVYEDATVIYDWLQAQGHKKIMVYGYSFGCTVAINLATKRPVAGLALTAPFASLKRIAKDIDIPLAAWVLKDTYPSEDYAVQINCPVIMVHGKKDKLIPYHHSEILYQKFASKDKELIFLDSENHNSIYFTQHNLPYILDWLKRH